jgi:tetratricopeptide (TPR) repeat protein
MTTASEFHQRGLEMAAKGDYVAAINDFRRAIELESGVARYYSDRALAKWNRGWQAGMDEIVLDSVIADYTKASALDPHNPWVRHNRGCAREVRGNMDGALDDFTAAIALKPDAALAYRQRGLVKLRLGRDEEAHQDLNRAVELMPDLKSDLAESIEFAKTHPHPPPDDGVLEL